jgi:hypothetical protein
MTFAVRMAFAVFVVLGAILNVFWIAPLAPYSD